MTDSTSSQDRTPGTLGTSVRAPGPAAPSVAVLPTLPGNPGGERTGFELWLHRFTVLLFVFVCAVVGVLLVILPWRPEWTDNRIFLVYPALRDFFSHGFVRGLCSGLGVLDIWIGFWEAVHYHEGKQP